jgi:phenylpropionate dioxygenase-like ring-hydroxylating dioxygenase large terminal subunit
MDPSAEPLETFLAPVMERLAPYRIDQMVYQSLRSTTVKCNWKIGVEAFIESYHLIGTHPQTAVSSNDTAATYDVLGSHGEFIVPMGIPSGRLPSVDESAVLDEMITNMLTVQYVLPDQLKYLRKLQAGEERLPAGQSLRQLLIDMSKDRANIQGFNVSNLNDSAFLDQHEFHVFPNMVFGLLPGEFFGFRFRPDGQDPESTIFEVISLRFPTADHQPVTPTFIPFSEDRDQLMRDWGGTLYQDFANVLKQQRGLHSRTLGHVRLASTQESLITNLHRTLDQYLETR